MFDKYISEKTRINYLLKLFGIVKVPMIGYVKSEVVNIDNQTCTIKLPLFRKTKNRMFNGMYIGALCVGADIVGGLYAQYFIRKQKDRISMIFKNLKVDFLKRAEGDVYFTCGNGKELEELIAKAINSKNREEQILRINAFVPSKLGKEPAAVFDMTMSVKVQPGKNS